MKRIVYGLIIFMVLIFVSSCSSTKYIKKTQTGQGSSEVSAPKPQQTTLKYPSVNVIGKNQMSFEKIKKQFEAIASDIHFKFNSYAIEPIHEYGINEYPHQILDRIANFLKTHPEVRIRIEGNCDERGTIEYNLALGEKRALAAKNYLVLLGIDPKRIEIVSYGESKPVDPAHNEYAWAKNRRDHFVILK